MSHWHKWVPALLGFALSLALLAALWWCLRKWQIMVTRVNQFQHMSIFHHFNRGVTSDMKAHERMSMMSLLVASVSSSSSCCGKEHSSETSRSSRLKEWDFLSEKALSKEASCWCFVRISSVFATIFSQSGNSWRRPSPWAVLHLVPLHPWYKIFNVNVHAFRVSKRRRGRAVGECVGWREHCGMKNECGYEF